MPLDDSLENRQEAMTIDVIAVDGHLGVPPRHHVIEGTGSEDAVWSRHGVPRINRHSSFSGRSFKAFSVGFRFARQNLQR